MNPTKELLWGLWVICCCIPTEAAAANEQHKQSRVFCRDRSKAVHSKHNPETLNLM